MFKLKKVLINILQPSHTAPEMKSPKRQLLNMWPVDRWAPCIPPEQVT